MSWIKIEFNTCEKPEVIEIAAILGVHRNFVMGALIRLWGWADQNCVAGEAVKITEAFIDEKCGKRGFSAAMRQVGWITGPDRNMCFPNFTRHNGKSAKSRAENSRRMKADRAESVHEMCEPCAENVRSETTPDKIREEKKREGSEIPPPATASAKKPRKPVERNAVMDALARIEVGQDYDLKQVTQQAWARYAKARAEITAVWTDPDTLPAEIERRSGNLRKAWPNIKITALMLAGRWGDKEAAMGAELSIFEVMAARQTAQT